MLSLLSLILISLLASSSCSYAQSPPPLPLMVCPGSATPVVLGDTLSFCGYTGISCCDTVDDEALEEQFNMMISANMASDTVCSSMAALCTIKCRPFLSASGTAADSTAALPGSVVTEPLPCTSSSPSSSPAASSPPQQDPSSGTLCLDRVAEGSYSAMAAHPDASGRVFLATRDGEIWLASMPEPGAGGAMRVAGGPFLDLTVSRRPRAHRKVLRNEALPRPLGIAAHPRFTSNGRFFVSYACDNGGSPSPTGGLCSAAAAGRGNNDGSGPCQHRQLVVAEFTAKATDGGKDYSKCDPSDVRKLFSMCLPELAISSYSNDQHGGVGQILFRPSSGHGDGGAYLYLVTSAEIMRLDVDSNSSSTAKMETYAMDLSNPRGCSFDPQRPSYMYCANIDQQQYEQVHLITDNHSSAVSPTPAVVSVINHGRPAGGRAPSIIGGLVYRGSTDPSLKGRYVYMYGGSAWAAAAVETPASGGSYYAAAAARIPNLSCSRSSPLPCHGASGIRAVSFGQDSSNDAAFVLATDGVYRVASPGLCGGGAPAPPQPPPPTPTPTPVVVSAWGLALVLVLGALGSGLALYLICSPPFVNGATIRAHLNCRFSNVMCCISMSRSGGAAGAGNGAQ